MPEIPQGPADIAAKYNELLRRVQALETQNAFVNATIPSGGIQVTNGGSVQVVGPTGIPTAIIGALPSQYNRIDGSSQQGVLLYREDGTMTLMVADGSPTTSPTKQAFQVQDRTGHIVIADDTNGGMGIALPYLQFAPFASNTAPTDTTTSATYTTLQAANGMWMNPKIVIQILVRSSDSATTGNVRVIDQNNNVIGSPIAVAANDFKYVNIGPVALPGNFKDSVTLSIQAQRTAGTGTIGVRGITAVGQQS